ncbi:BNR/Asp-box repeat protein [Punctularia strigosozonata HHB-11173 SS5]|uniref:BNR/Asp-box repeat protein n=1 Tax=Punctularia strigosozonata (strain HHB-11173) TaxID=741275 RepID=UPI0004418710|nr:BNR/Asp-box repeat protein [Punctularia strigosozonata HHB-11173 SS5]EIN08269.1 BNR/Asp-box repeat protein [Punctularia strigosozonata HHB-11173 SS5]
MLTSLSLLGLLSLFTLGQCAIAPKPRVSETFTNADIFKPPSTYTIPRTLYARTVLLNQNHKTSNVILATWENYSPEPPYFPIFRSTDLGRTWTHISNATDQVNGWGLRYQPFLYELPQNIGSFKAGTILLAGNSIPEDLSLTKIDLYASTDKGLTWKFVSSIASGGRAIPNNGETPVWEPFLLVWNNKLVVYYSDQRDPAHGQKLVHQVSRDLIHWEDPVDDVAYDTFDFRPGMTTIAKLPNKQFILTYEFFGAPEASFAVYYRLSADPFAFNSAPGQVVRATDGTVPTSSPYVVWSPVGGPNGTIAVSANSNTEIFLNTGLAANGSHWIKTSTPASRSYTRHLRVMPNSTELMIVGAGVLSGSNNWVNASVIAL